MNQLPKNAEMNADDLTIIDGAEELSQHTDLPIGFTTKLIDLIKARSSVRDCRPDEIIVVLEDWMAGYKRDDGQNASEVVLVYGIEDYSKKAWKTGGTEYVDVDKMSGTWQFDGDNHRDVLHYHENDGEFNTPNGVTWLAKSGVKGIYALEGNDR